MPMIAVIFDGLHLKLRFSIYDFRRRAGEALSMLRCVSEWQEQRSVKDVMDGPRRGKVELVGDGGYLLDNGEGSVPPQGQFERRVG